MKNLLNEAIIICDCGTLTVCYNFHQVCYFLFPLHREKVAQTILMLRRLVWYYGINLPIDMSYRQRKSPCNNLSICWLSHML